MIKKLLTITLCLGVLLAAGCSAVKPELSQTAEPIELNVSAGVGMKDALMEVQSNYQAKHPHIKIIYNFAAAGVLEKQIEQGAPADLFISAAAKQMDELEAKHLLVQDSRKNLLENQLVLIIPQNAKVQVEKFTDLTLPGVKKIGIGAPETVPAGQYAKEVLIRLKLWDTLKDKMVMAKDVRSVLAYMETGNAEAGLVYKTDSLISKKVKVVAVAPPSASKPIVFPAALLASGKHQQAARDFLDYLSGPEGKTIFEKYGFTMCK